MTTDEKIRYALASKIAARANSNTRIYHKSGMKGLIFEEQVRNVRQLIEDEKRELLERIRQWTKYNKHDLGEVGEFIRTQYVYNKLDEELNNLQGESHE